MGESRLRHPSSRPRPLAGLLVALLATVLTGCGGAAAEPGRMAGKALQNPYTVPDVDLVDTAGQPFSLAADTRERLTLVFFGYTHCPDICQVVMANLASAVSQLDDEDRSQVQVVFVTTDPARDTPGALRAYLDRLDPDFEGLTGDVATLAEVGKPLAVAFTQGERLPDGGYDVTHSTQVLGVDVDDRVPVYWDQETTARQYAADIHTLLTTKS